MRAISVGGIEVPLHEYECEIVCNGRDCQGCELNHGGACWAEYHATFATNERQALEHLEAIAEELGGILIGRVEQVDE